MNKIVTACSRILNNSNIRLITFQDQSIDLQLGEDHSCLRIEIYPGAVNSKTNFLFFDE